MNAGGLVADVGDQAAIETILERTLATWDTGRLDDLRPDPQVRPQYAVEAVARHSDAIVQSTVDGPG